MKWIPLGGPPTDPASVAAYFGLIAGALAWVDPFFDGLVAALAALLVAAVVVGRTRGMGRSIPSGRLAAFGSLLVTAWGVYLWNPLWLAGPRGLLLGAGSFAFWWGVVAERRPLRGGP